MDILSVLGILLSLVAGAGIAFGIVMQRFALSYPKARVPLWGTGRSVSQTKLWCLGVIIYLAANGFYAASLTVAPLSVAASVFNMLLVFNLGFSRWLLGEVLTPAKVIGAILIVIGTCLTVAGSPDGIPTQYEPATVLEFLTSPRGAAYFCALVGSFWLSTLMCYIYDRFYPPIWKVLRDSKRDSKGKEDAQKEPSSINTTQADSASVDSPPDWIEVPFEDPKIDLRIITAKQMMVAHVQSEDSTQTTAAHDSSDETVAHGDGTLLYPEAEGLPPYLPASRQVSPGVLKLEPLEPKPRGVTELKLNRSDKQTGEQGEAAAMTKAKSDSTIAILDLELRHPPWVLKEIMAVAFPGTLGLDEGIAHLALKAVVAMLPYVLHGEGTSWVFWADFLLWCVSAWAAVWGLKVVYARFESTRALPVNYGIDNAVSVCTGLVFFNEQQYMSDAQLSFTLAGLATILFGIFVGRMERAENETRRADSAGNNRCSI